jgi:hypothetical protein
MGEDRMSNGAEHEVAHAELSAAPEPWESWETTLVLASLAIGVAGLVVLGWLVARFVLP